MAATPFHYLHVSARGSEPGTVQLTAVGIDHATRKVIPVHLDYVLADPSSKIALAECLIIGAMRLLALLEQELASDN